MQRDHSALHGTDVSFYFTHVIQENLDFLFCSKLHRLLVSKKIPSLCVTLHEKSAEKHWPVQSQSLIQRLILKLTENY